MVKLLAEKFSNVGELVEILSKLPPKTKLDPLGEPECGVAYDAKARRAYIDNIDYIKYDLMEMEDD